VQRTDVDSKVIVKSNTIAVTISEDPPPSFSLTLTAEPDVAKAGDPVLLDIRLTNTTDEQIWLLGLAAAPKGYAANYKLDIRDAQGQPVPLKKSLRLWSSMLGASGRLAPGESDHDSIRLDEYYDLGKPGRYTISTQRTDPDNKAVATSNTATLTITGTPGQPQE
jgi:hypothetical protein